MTSSRGPAGGSNPRDLQAFLTDGRLEVIDVARGAARGTRRLVVGDKRASRPSYVVSVAIAPEAAPRVEAEARHLDELQQLVRPAMCDTLPLVVERVDVSGAPGVVFSAVPGLAPRLVTVPSTVEDETRAVLGWLTMLWSDTAGEPGPVDLGSEAYDSLLARLVGSGRAAPTLGALQRSRAALAERETARTVGHGCLCPRHLQLGDGRVIGADDWGRARFDADPLRDLGTWVVRAAGAGIGAVFAGRTGYARSLRDFVAGGLGYWGLPSRLWRDVLVLALAEAAVDGLEEQDTTAMERLSTVSHSLPSKPTTTRGTRQ